MPMASAGIGATNPDAGVMATSPATAPLAAPSTVGLPRPIHSANIQDSAAAAVAVLVATKALVARALAASALPALKPNQPNHRSAAPTRTNGMLWGGMGSEPYPSRLPSTKAHTSAEVPELMWTTVPPAKSRAPQPRMSPRAVPVAPHTMWQSGSYTSDAHRSEKTRKALNFMRSANAPVMSAGVMMANISW